MNVADLELCKELHKLSGWSSTDKIWFPYYDVPAEAPMEGEPPYWALTDKDGGSIVESENIPAYDAGYLLGKIFESDLPPIDYLCFYPYGNEVSAKLAAYNDFDESRSEDAPTKSTKVSENTRGKTHADALCKLAIELFKQGILTKERL